MKAEEKQSSLPVFGSESLGQSGWFDREVAFLRANSSTTRWIGVAILLTLFVDLLVIGTISTGPINVFHNDALLLLDDGWRVLNGQVPHRDFNSPLGPFEFFLVAGGMLLSRGTSQGIAIGIASFGLVLAFWTWMLCRKRMPPVFGVIITTWVVLTATCPTPLGFDPRYLSCAMIYNRQGYALLGIILVECALPREKSNFMLGFSSGIASVILGLLKLNFFGIAALFLLVTFPLTRTELSRFRGVLVGSGVGFLSTLLYPRFSFKSFFDDMSFVAHARESSLSLSNLLSGAVTCTKSGSFLLVPAMAITVLIFTEPGKRKGRNVITLVLISLIVLLSGPLFLATNSLENRCQLASLWIIILLERVSALHLQISEKKVVTLIVIAASLGSTMASFAPEALSTLNLLTYYSETQKSTGVQIDAPNAKNLRFYDSTSFYDMIKAGDGDGTFYSTCLNDGLALLKSQSKSKESVLVLGFHNPFSYLLRRSPAEGGSSYLLAGNSLSENHMPPVSWVFGNADLMMLPEYEGTHRSSDQFIQNFYKPYLQKNFHFVSGSQFWGLYRRNR